MSLKKKLFLGVAAAALPVTTSLFMVGAGTASAAAVVFDNSHDTVTCGAFFGTATISPPLTLGTPTADTIAVKGTLQDCTDGQGSVGPKNATSAAPFTATVSGVLNGASNSLLALSGCSSNTGSLTVKWNASGVVNAATAKLLDSTTTLTPASIFGGQVNAPSPLSTDNLPSGVVYGSFELGKLAQTNGCTVGATTGGFLGVDSGTGSESVAMTSNDIGSIIAGQPVKGTKETLTLGVGQVYVG